jgi:hypothetical protein
MRPERCEGDRLPTDRVVELAVLPPGHIYGVGRYRCAIVKWRSRWHWRTWDVVMPDFGGRGRLGEGWTGTKMRAMEEGLGLLRRAAGLEQIPCGSGGAVAGGDTLP